MRLTGPDSVFIELDLFVFDAAVDHGGEFAVADGKRFLLPGDGVARDARGRVPEKERAGSGASSHAEKAESGGEEWGGGNSKLEIRNSKQIRSSKFEGNAEAHEVNQAFAQSTVKATAGPS